MKTTILFFIFSGLFFFFQSCNDSNTVENSTKKPPLKKNLVKGKKKKKEAKENLPKILIDSLLINHLTGQCAYEKDTCFKLVPKHATTRNIHLQKETCDMFLKMKSAAEKDSVFLKINSGARNFNVQKYIWENKWDGKKRLRDGSSAKKIKNPKERSLKLLLYTAMPGTSRHHWGTEIDLYHVNGNKYYEKGKGLKEYEWLLKNAHKYGFHQVYSNKEKDNRTGYQEEKWHWSYMPISNLYHKKYKQLISYKDISGFKGASTAKEIKAIENYVNGINADYP
ncbi:MAG: M15 family metallopeptidase [Crocinitomicaceae bacterium]|nr:M15 family metallopeptidase [Crocinitomicaceae bacterium]